MAELLAPAGNFDALKAAVEAGADAVYLAGESFGARAYAGNFSNDEILKAVEFAHLRGVHIHVTVNTILGDDEISAFVEYLKFLRHANVDALIIQDLGAVKLAKKFAPEIPLHASTQMTIHNLEGVKFLAELGFSRVVLARELSLKEIEYIAKNSPIEIETFIHGALCVCCSGQCFMSSMIGGRSGNRGKCAQPCRLPYELVDADGKNILSDAGKYLLSPKDLNTLDLLQKIISAGVTSLKIEGRMKRPEYVATVVSVYRKVLDNFSPTADDHNKLAQIFNRDFTTAYLEKNPGKNLISDKKPNNRGVPVGRVAKVERDKIFLKCSGEIHEGDQIEIWIKVGGRCTFTVKNFSVVSGVYCIDVADTRGVKLNDRAFKIFDAELTAEARKFFVGESPVRKIPVTAEIFVELGKPLTLKMTDADGNFAQAQTNFIAEVAKNRPLNLETLSKQIGRLGNSVFELKNLSADVGENIMIQISELNEVRRNVTEQLEKIRLEKFERKLNFIDRNDEKISALRITHSAFVTAQVDTIEKIKIAVKNGADGILYGGENFNHRIITPDEILKAQEIAKSHGKNFYLATPRIVRENEFDSLEKILTCTNFDAVYAHNLATIHFAKKFTDSPIHTDFSLIAFNLETIKFLKNLGVAGITLSPEMTLQQIKTLAKNSPLPLECIVHGRAELMISFYCVLGSFLGEIDKKICPNICRKKFFLRDRKEMIFPIATDQFCRMHILNSKTLSMIEHRNNFDGVDKIRVDCRALSVEEIGKTIHAYKFGGDEITNYTRGHFFRDRDF